MISKILSIGDKVDIWKNEVDEDEVSPTLSSRILDFLDDKTLKIALPMEKVRAVSLRQGSLRMLRFYAKNGSYSAKGRILEGYQEDAMAVLMVELLSEPEKIQRRKFYRVECVMDVQARILKEEEIKHIEKYEQKGVNNTPQMDALFKQIASAQDPWEKGIVTDISGGGLRFTTRISKAPGDLLFLKLYMDQNDTGTTHDLLAQVVSSSELKKRPGHYENRARFISLSKTEREEIIRYVFEEDRKRRKRERG